MLGLTVRGKKYICACCQKTDIVLFEDGLQDTPMTQREYDQEIKHQAKFDDPEFLYAPDVLCDDCVMIFTD